MEKELDFLDESTAKKKGDAILGRMLNTPPKLHKPKTKKEKPPKGDSSLSKQNKG